MTAKEKMRDEIIAKQKEELDAFEKLPDVEIDKVSYSVNRLYAHIKEHEIPTILHELTAKLQCKYVLMRYSIVCGIVDLEYDFCNTPVDLYVQCDDQQAFIKKISGGKCHIKQETIDKRTVVCGIN
jgi:hypothetical protein